MNSNLISHFQYIQNLILKSQLSETEESEGNVFTPIFNLEIVATDLTLDPSVRNFVLKLDNIYHILRKVCNHLSMYHLVLMYVDLAKESLEWKSALEKEMESRVMSFNWQLTNCSDTCVTLSRHKPHTISHSPRFFHTQIKSALIFFDVNFPPFVNYNISNLDYKQGKFFYEFLLEDIAFGSSVSFICIGMMGIKFCDARRNEYRNTIYTSLFVPPIPDIDVKFCSTPDEVCNMMDSEHRVECLLVFTTGRSPTVEVDMIMNHLRSTKCPNIPVTGAYKLHSMVRYQTLYGMNFISFVAFTRKVNSKTHFSASTLVIYEPDYFEEHLIDLKQNLVRHEEEFCICFIHNTLEQRLDEWGMITRHINCAVMQCEAEGVFGNMGSFNNPSDKKSGLQPPAINPDDIMRPYTCAIMYIGWGNIKLI